MTTKPDTSRPAVSGKTPIQIVHISDIHVDLNYTTGMYCIYVKSSIKNLLIIVQEPRTTVRRTSAAERTQQTRQLVLLITLLEHTETLTVMLHSL